MLLSLVKMLKNSIIKVMSNTSFLNRVLINVDNPLTSLYTFNLSQFLEVKQQQQQKKHPDNAQLIVEGGSRK